MSQRVRGNSKRIPVIKAKFYPCEPSQKAAVLEQIHNDSEVVDFLQGHQFGGHNLFTRQDPEHLYIGNLRGWNKVLFYKDMKKSLWGIRIGHEEARLTECYDEGRLGLCLRVATGETTVAEDLEAYKSMYQGV